MLSHDHTQAPLPARVHPAGECSNCCEDAGRLLDPPLLRIPMEDSLYPGEELRWKEPAGRFESLYYVRGATEGAALAIPYEQSESPVCVPCWTAAVWPSLYPFLANKPEQLGLNGWAEPTWKDA